jgi:hypothetical protein
MDTRANGPHYELWSLSRLKRYAYKRNSLVNFLDMQVAHISCHITTTKYKNIKMINLIHMISILYSVFPFCYTRRDEQNKISFVYVLKIF